MRGSRDLGRWLQSVRRSGARSCLKQGRAIIWDMEADGAAGLFGRQSVVARSRNKLTARDAAVWANRWVQGCVFGFCAMGGWER